MSKNQICQEDKPDELFTEGSLNKSEEDCMSKISYIIILRTQPGKFYVVQCDLVPLKASSAYIFAFYIFIIFVFI